MCLIENQMRALIDHKLLDGNKMVFHDGFQKKLCFMGDTVAHQLPKYLLSVSPP